MRDGTHAAPPQQARWITVAQCTEGRIRMRQAGQTLLCQPADRW
jgi:hypothetical protein